MKNKFALLALLGLFLIGGSYNVYAQESDSILNEEVVEETMPAMNENPSITEISEEKPASFHLATSQLATSKPSAIEFLAPPPPSASGGSSSPIN